MPRSRNAWLNLSKEDCFDEDISVTALERAPKTQDSQVYKCHNIAPLSLKNGRAQYWEGSRDKEDGRDKRGRENRKGKRDRGGHRGNKVNPVVGKSNGFETSVYHHIIY